MNQEPRVLPCRGVGPCHQLLSSGLGSWMPRAWLVFKPFDFLERLEQPRFNDLFVSLLTWCQVSCKELEPKSGHGPQREGLRLESGPAGGLGFSWSL